MMTNALMTLTPINKFTLMHKRNRKTYIISDTHFCHDRIITDFCFRPENFEKLIINNWKNTVHPEDIVFHLGDVTWGKKEHLKEIMSELPGTKVLIRGNHDKSHSDNWFIDTGFSVILNKAQIGEVILSHKPTTLREEEIERGIINVFGHFHNTTPDRWEGYLKKRLTLHHYLFILEEMGYNLININDIKTKTKNAYSVLDEHLKILSEIPS